MKYRNKSPFWRQAGEALVPPLGVSPDLDAPPIGGDWEPVAEPAPDAAAVAPAPVAESAPAEEPTPEPNGKKRKGGSN